METKRDCGPPSFSPDDPVSMASALKWYVENMDARINELDLEVKSMQYANNLVATLEGLPEFAGHARNATHAELFRWVLPYARAAVIDGCLTDEAVSRIAKSNVGPKLEVVARDGRLVED